MYETSFEKFEPYFGQENIQFYGMDTDGFVLSINTIEVIKELTNLNDLFDISNLNKNHDLFSKKSKRLFRKNNIEKS